MLQADRERLTQLAFEKFDVAGLFLAEQSILSLYSVGKTTGLVVDFGHGKTGRCAQSESCKQSLGPRIRMFVDKNPKRAFNLPSGYYP